MMKQNTFLWLMIFLSLFALSVLSYDYYVHDSCFLWGESIWCGVEFGIYVLLLGVTVLGMKFLKS
jgi:hypothetical protein